MKPARIISAIAATGIALTLPLSYPRATISSCTGSISPSSMTSNTMETFVVTLTNGDAAQDTTGVTIMPPSDLYQVESGSASGWSAQKDGSAIIFTGGAISPGQSQEFVVTITNTGGTEAASQWSASMSSAENGDMTTCDGSYETSITEAVVNDRTGPSISGVTVSERTASWASVTWTTDEPSTSYVAYGKGNTDTNAGSGDLVTSHTVILVNLSASTPYSYKVVSTDGSNNRSESDTRTFETTSQPAPTPTPTAIIRMVTPSATPTPIPDTTPPKVVLTTTTDKPVVKAPEFSGRATDDSGIASVSYSLDNGKNWTPVDTLNAPGKSKATFSFTPGRLDDDTYMVLVRASDTKGNTGYTQPQTMVVDRLPPRIGPVMVRTGPVVNGTDGSGAVRMLAGTDQKLVMSAVGGPTKIDVYGRLFHQSLAKDTSTGLWWGIVRFDVPGTETLSAVAVDGAGNTVTSALPRMNVMPQGSVTGQDGKPVFGATATVFVRNTETREFTVWNAGPYGQSNPQVTGSQGEFGWYVPPGTYYVDVRAPGYKPVLSDITDLQSDGPVTSSVRLQAVPGLRVGPFTFRIPFSGTGRTLLDTASVTSPVPSQLTGTQFPEFTLPGGETTFSWRGRPLLIGVVAIWDPSTLGMLSALKTTAAAEGRTPIALFVHSPQAAVDLFARRAGLDIPAVADPDGDGYRLLSPLNVPSRISVDTHGRIESVDFGQGRVH